MALTRTSEVIPVLNGQVTLGHVAGVLVALQAVWRQPPRGERHLFRVSAGPMARASKRLA